MGIHIDICASQETQHDHGGDAVALVRYLDRPRALGLYIVHSEWQPDSL